MIIHCLQRQFSNNKTYIFLTVNLQAFSDTPHQRNRTLYFLFQWYFEYQQLNSQGQESKDSNIKPVTVKVMSCYPYFIRPTLMHNFLYIRLSEPGGCIGSHPQQSVNDAHPSGSSVLTVRLEPPTLRLAEPVRQPLHHF